MLNSLQKSHKTVEALIGLPARTVCEYTLLFIYIDLYVRVEAFESLDLEKSWAVRAAGPPLTALKFITTAIYNVKLYFDKMEAFLR